MQKDNGTEVTTQDFSPELAENSQSEAPVAKKRAPRRKTEASGDSAEKKSVSAKNSASEKKSPAKKAVSTKSASTARKSSSSKSTPAAKKSTASKSAAAKDIDKEAASVSDSANADSATEATVIAPINDASEMPTSVPEENSAEIAQEASEPSVQDNKDFSEELPLPPDTETEDDFDIVLIPTDAKDAQTDEKTDDTLTVTEVSENASGLLNVEHFSDYKQKQIQNEEEEHYSENCVVYKENITILSPEEPSLPEQITKNKKYENPDSKRYDPKHPRKVDSRFDFIELFVFTLLAVILLTTFVFRHTVVKGGSMENTLFDGEHLIISDLFYTPQRGDIIVCQDMEDYDLPVVKRVIATAGEKVEISSGIVYINGEKLEEDYIFLDGPDKYSDFPEVTVPEGMIFVLGDHRNNSADSRLFPTVFVREDAVLGKVILRFYPFDKFGAVN